MLVKQEHEIFFQILQWNIGIRCGYKISDRDRDLDPDLAVFLNADPDLALQNCNGTFKLKT